MIILLSIMYNNTLKKINNKYSLKELFSKIEETVNLSTHSLTVISQALLKKSRGIDLIPYEPTTILRITNERISSVVYQILIHNNIKVSKLLRHYNNKINRGVKPSKIVGQSSSKIRTILKILKENKIIFTNLKGISLENQFRVSLLNNLDLE